MSSLTDAVRQWLFRGLTIEDALDRLEHDGTPVRAQYDPRAIQRVIPLQDYSPHIRTAAMAALPAYLAFFCLENSVREFVADRLQENRGTDWWSKSVSQPIRDKVARRREAESANRWHIERGAADINYTDFGDLKGIIQANWSEFADAFPDQNWVLSRLTELENSRNVIAHSNVLDARELSRVRLYLQDWQRQVG